VGGRRGRLHLPLDDSKASNHPLTEGPLTEGSLGSGSNNPMTPRAWVSITSSGRMLAGATGANVVRARSVNAGSDQFLRAGHCHQPPERMWAAAGCPASAWAWRRRVVAAGQLDILMTATQARTS
jgi:hypothetical protein